MVQPHKWLQTIFHNCLFLGQLHIVTGDYVFPKAMWFGLNRWTRSLSRLRKTSERSSKINSHWALLLDTPIVSFFRGSTVWSRTGSCGGEAEMGERWGGRVCPVFQQKRGAFELNIGWERSSEGLGRRNKQTCVHSVGRHMTTVRESKLHDSEMVLLCIKMKKIRIRNSVKSSAWCL